MDSDDKQLQEPTAESQAEPEPKAEGAEDLETLEAAIEGALKPEEGEPKAEEEPGEEADEEAGEEEPKAEGEKEPAEGPAEEDEEDDEKLIASLSERAQRRFRELRERALTSEQQLMEWRQALDSTGATPEEFASLVEYARLVHSPDPAAKRRALEIIEAERNALARELGEALPGTDPLDDFPDLKRRVEEMDLSVEDAAQIAKARRLEAKLSEQGRQTAEQQQAAMQQQLEAQQAIEQLNALGQQLQAQDPDYPKKLEILLQRQIPWIRENLPPAQWPQATLVAYEQLNEAMKAAETARKAAPRPLRPSGAPGGGTQEPKSLEDAVARALEESSE